MAARQPPLQIQRLQPLWRRNQPFLSSKLICSGCSPAGCRRPLDAPARGACSRVGGGAAVGSERPAAAGLPRAQRAGLPSAQPVSGPHPLSADALERAGGEGARADGEGGLLGGPSPGAPVLRARESSLPPSLAPGKVPGRSLSRLLQPNG